jgi:hypothetical protein
LIALSKENVFMGYFMKSVSNSRQILAGLAFGFFVVTGTYNAIVINSESAISGDSIRFIKRLDEAYGVVVSKREVATSMPWQKLSIKQAAIFKSKIQNNDQRFQQSSSADQAPSEVAAQAAVQEDLNLSLTGVINPKKWQQGLNATQFNGSLSTNQGVIESLSVSLPNDEGLSVSFSEMTGNVFEYDFNGELYSGMMYQENQNSYVVTLTNGPLEGTRLTFTGEASVENVAQQEDAQRTLAENSDGDAGMQQEQEIAQQDPAALENSEINDAYAQEQGQIEQAQGFNFEQSQVSM